MDIFSWVILYALLCTGFFFFSVSVPSKAYRIMCASHRGRRRGEHHIIIEMSGDSNPTGAEDMLGWSGQCRASPQKPSLPRHLGTLPLLPTRPDCRAPALVVPADS